MFKRVCSLLLLVLLVTTALSACSEPAENTTNNDTTAPTTAETTTPAETEPAETAFDPFSAFPADLRYDGEEFCFLNGCTSSWYTRNSILASEQTGEPINDGIYKRQRKVEERFGVKITEVSTTDISGDTRRAIQANLTDYDAMLINLMGVYSLAQEGLFLNLKEMPNLNLAADWWDQNAVNDMSVAGKLFFCTSDFDITRLDGIRTLYFNKEMITDFHLENPYELVDGNKWTIDKYIEMATAVKADLDGDGIATDADRYGIVSYDEILVDMLTNAGGFKFLSKDKDDMIVSTINDERYFTLYEKIRHILHDDNITFDVRNSRFDKYKRGLGDRVQEALFLGNQALFYSETMAWTRVLREMEADFGVLPPPKFDENQSRYYSVIINPFVTAVPNNTVDPEFTGTMLEALAAASHDTVVPAYIDITLTGKVARDEDTVRMLELVFDNLAYNIHISSVVTRSTIVSAAKGNRASLTSLLASMEKAVSRTLPKINEAFVELK